jgi:hypothetical protein
MARLAVTAPAGAVNRAPSYDRPRPGRRLRPTPQSSEADRTPETPTQASKCRSLVDEPDSPVHAANTKSIATTGCSRWLRRSGRPGPRCCCGADRALDPELVVTALAALADHHDALPMSGSHREGGANLEHGCALNCTERQSLGAERRRISCGSSVSAGQRLVHATLAVWGSGVRTPQLHRLT